MSRIWKVMVRRGASSPCVQWCIVEVSSYVSLGESSRSVHGDERGMLRIISSPLEKIRPRIVILITMETVVVDGLAVGRSGSHGAIQVLQGVAGVVYTQNEQTQTTLKNIMVRAYKVSIM